LNDRKGRIFPIIGGFDTAAEQRRRLLNHLEQQFPQNIGLIQKGGFWLKSKDESQEQVIMQRFVKITLTRGEKYGPKTMVKSARYADRPQEALQSHHPDR
jgi:hypothetical protein